MKKIFLIIVIVFGVKAFSQEPMNVVKAGIIKVLNEDYIESNFMTMFTFNDDVLVQVMYFDDLCDYFDKTSRKERKKMRESMKKQYLIDTMAKFLYKEIIEDEDLVESLVEIEFYRYRFIYVDEDYGQYKSKTFKL